ncbi:hypothetical protein uav_166 [Pseudomonas phage UAVern]|uniref:Uncharacterized protein n=1 Tax=Pseudomonas phage UAVern TaxID=2856997 RepID=A0A975UWD8_9CAUD|nr:hypothetical protein uav_166 [Pseudomonas phage UAVern]
MRETMYRLIWMLVWVAVFAGGVALMGSTSKWTKQAPREALMVDAYEAYNESGTPRWTGIFRDKKLNTRFEWPIEPRTFREFTATNTPKDMVVIASRGQVNDPTEPTSKQGFAGGLIFLGIGGFLWNLFAVFFFRDPWRFG